MFGPMHLPKPFQNRPEQLLKVSAAAPRVRWSPLNLTPVVVAILYAFLNIESVEGSSEYATNCRSRS